MRSHCYISRAIHRPFHGRCLTCFQVGVYIGVGSSRQCVTANRYHSQFSQNRLSASFPGGSISSGIFQGANGIAGSTAFSPTQQVCQIKKNASPQVKYGNRTGHHTSCYTSDVLLYSFKTVPQYFCNKISWTFLMIQSYITVTTVNINVQPIFLL